MTVFYKSLQALACACALATPATAADYVLPRDLDTRSETACAGETAFGNFVADALKKIHGADIAMVNCTALRGTGIHAKGTVFDGPAAAADVAAESRLVQIEVTGLQVLDALEQAVAALPGTSGAFVQIAGVRMEVDVKNPAGTRIVKLTSNAAALDFARIYRVAATEEVVKALPALAQAKRIEGQAVPLAADVATHLQATGVRDIKVLGRIKVKP